MNGKKQYFRVITVFCSLFILLSINTCKKIELSREALVETNSHSIADGTVALTGTIIDLGEGISDHGFVVSNTPDPLISNGIVLRLGSASGTGQFTCNSSEVGSGLDYYFRAFATTGGETIYGETSNFSTPDLIVITHTAEIQNRSTVSLVGAINRLGFESVTDHGFYWADDPTPQSFAENKISLGAASVATAFSYILGELTPYKEYYFVAYAQNDSETKYGDVTGFKIENVWTQIADFAGPARCRALAFSLGESGYITGGEDAGSINDFYQFTPDAATWTSLSSGSSPVNGTAFTIGNKAYVIHENNFYEFDPDNGTWIAKANFPGTPRWHMFAFSVGNRGYVGCGAIGGGSQDVYYNDFWEFDPQDDVTNGTDINGDPMGSWIQKVDFPAIGREFGEGFSIATYGYLCSGHNNDNGNLNDFWQYDPFSTDNGTDANGNPMGAWSQKTDYPGPLVTNMVSFIIDNKAYLFNYELWQYNPVTDSWVKMADFPGQSRFAPVGFAINNKGYVGTGVYQEGVNNVFLNDFWEYLPHQ
ncbi:MAG: hypothetical protein K8R53_06110 [Bacteroidales bacterium]|nr:hypothetical protein [Bacteroidales bacterium]